MAAQNHRRNAFWGLVSTVTDILCGLLYTSRLLLNAYGATAHGLINAINNFLGLILALELAFIMLARNSYYRPLADNDKTKLNLFYRRNRRALYRMGLLAVVLTVIVALIFPLFYLNQFTYWDTAILVFALGLYLLVQASTRADTGLLTADYKSYIIKILSTFTTLLTTFLCYWLVRWQFNLQTVKMVVALALLIQPLFYGIYIHRHYKMPKPEVDLPPRKLEPIIVVERITNAFLSRTNILILAISATLTDVSIYAVYYMVGRYLTRCINGLFTGREAVYGHAFANEDKLTVKKTYAQTNFLLANVLGIVFGIGVVMLNPFVKLYTKWVFGVNYSQFWFGFLLLVAQMLTCIRETQMKVIYTSGRVRHGQIVFDAIMEAVINLVVSVALVATLGIVGVAIGTVAALVYRVIRLLIYRRKHVIKGSLWQTIRRYIPTLAMIGIALLVVLYFEPHPTNKVEWTLGCIQIGAIFVLIDLFLNLIINFKETKSFLIQTYWLWIEAFRSTRRWIKKLPRTIHRRIVKLARSIRRLCVFGWKALGGIYQRGLVRAVRTYFAHKKAQAFETAHPDMADLPYLTAIGKIYHGLNLNLTNPKTLNEKINWLKINYQPDLITTMSDKVAAKDYVAQTLGAEYVIPTYGVWNSFDEIDWDSLPQSFVLKCTHDSGSIYVVKDKAQLDKAKAQRHFEHYLNFEYWRKLREWGYQNVRPRIIAEEYLPSLGHRNSTEYKFTCFNGKVVFGTICSGVPHGFNKRRVNDFYTPDFRHLRWRAWYRNAHRRPQKPAQWEDMIAISEKFAKDFPHLRVDLYLVNGKIYFGEFTFYTGGGFIEFHPRKMDLILGQQLTLPTTPIISDNAMYRVNQSAARIVEPIGKKFHLLKKLIKIYHPDDENLLKMIGRLYLGYEMDLDNPRTFNEKINWLKLHYRPAIYNELFNQITAREYIAHTIGKQYLSPLVGVWEHFNDIDFNHLPTPSYIFCNYSNIRHKVTNKTTNLNQLLLHLQFNCNQICILQNRYQELTRNGIQPYFVEFYPQIHQNTPSFNHMLRCYYCNGKIKFVMIHDESTIVRYYTPDFQPLDWSTLAHPQSSKQFKKPESWEQIMALGAKLAGDLPFVGIRFKIYGDKFYFLDYTFDIDNGFAEFCPAELDLTLGDMITLPEPCYDGFPTQDQTTKLIPFTAPLAQTNADEPTEDLSDEDYDE